MEWKQIEGYENYSVSDTGLIRNENTGRILLLYKDRCGYLRTALSKNGKVKHFSVHRIVANAFIPNPGNLETVDHINGNKEDNRVSNLQWLSNGDNLEKYWKQHRSPVVCFEICIFSGEKSMLKMVRYKNREQWLKARTKFIGGSDIASIMGLSAWKTNQQLYREKKGLVMPDDLSDNPLVQYGTKAEEHIRAMFELDYPNLKVEYVPDNSWRNTKYPFAACSLDGWLTDESGRKGILEIKTATITSGSQAQKWKDRVPDNYYCQVLYYLGVTEWSFVDLRANLKYQFPNEPLYIATRDYHIERSEVEEDIATIMEKAAEFAESLEKNIEPPVVLTL